MSGINAPVSQALRAHGWHVEPFDWAIDKSMDLTRPELQATILQLAEECDAVMGAMDCSTLSRAREKPLLQHKHPPRPLRSIHHVEGLPTLSAQERARVLAANSLVYFFSKVAKVMSTARKACVLENPLRAYFGFFFHALQICFLYLIGKTSITWLAL